MSKNLIAAFFFIALIAVIFLLSNCAIRVTPQGGDKDITPPKVLKTEPINYSINFSAKEFRVYFDELIDLKEVSRQLIVSPLLKNIPDIKVKNKELIVEINDTLKPNTTYTFNFGNAIADVHESNILENFQYVFATGDHLDSLQVRGKTFFANNLKSEKGIAVMLYENANDSCIYKRLPDYFSTTDESGNFIFRNLHAGNYKLMALKDDNSNYLADANAEALAFLNHDITIPDTSLFKLYLFNPAEKETHLLKSRLDEKNKVLLQFTSSCQDFSYKLLDNKLSTKNIVTETSLNKDSIILWIDDTIADSLNMVVLNKLQVLDTIAIQLKSEQKQKATGRGTPLIAGLNATLNTNGVYFELGNKAILTFSRPLKNFMKEQVLFSRDSVLQKDFSFSNADSLNRKFFLNYNFTQLHKYDLIIPAGAVTDFTGNKNDSVLLNFTTRDERDYGSVELKFETISTNKHFIIQLVDETDKAVREFYVEKKADLKIENLLPGKYRIKLIDDSNENRKWDTGDYALKLQPETVIYYGDIINVRANWDLEVNWQVQ